jgi:integrase
MGRTRTESNAHNFQTVDQRTDPGHGRKPAAATRAKELLTDRIVRELPAPVRGAKITYDGGDPNKRVSGFGVRVTTAGQRAFILNYWIRGLERRCTIGRFPDWNTSDARAKAKELKREIDQGGDPLLEERKEREAPTMRDLIERWHAVKAPKKTSERSRREDESLIRQWIDPELGNRKVAEFRASHIDRLHHKITAHGTPVRANRTIALVKHLFNLAIRWELRADNPAAGIEWNHEEPVGRYLEGDELDRLVAALAADRNQTAADAIRLMVLTGVRSGEVFKAVWPQFDLEAGVWTKPSSHTKRKRSHRVPLSAAATQLLLGMKEQAAAGAQQQQRLPSPNLFPAARRNGHIVDVKSTWRRVCAAAGLDDIRIHDLRHSFASLAVNAGVDLPVIGKLLGHTQLKATMRYAHLFDSPLRVATGRVGAIVTAAANQPKDEIIPLPQRKG